MPTAAAPSRQVREHSALLPWQAGLHLAPPLLQDDGGVHAGGLCPRGASHLAGRARALDSLGAFLNAVPVAAAMRSCHLTGALLHGNCGRWRLQGSRGQEGPQPGQAKSQQPATRAPVPRGPLMHPFWDISASVCSSTGLRLTLPVPRRGHWSHPAA